MDGSADRGGVAAHFRAVQIPSYAGPVTYSICGLGIDETYQVVSEARAHGWYGNDDLIALVLQHGVEPDETTRQRIIGPSADVFLTANLAREIWLESLRRFRAEIIGIVRASGLQLLVPTVRRYKFSDLATPALVGLLSQELQQMDTDRFLELFLEDIVADTKVGGRLLTTTERQQHITSSRDTHLPWLLSCLGFDEHVFDRPPLNLIRRLGDRLVVVLRLISTLDWQQYAALLETFNRAMDELLYRSQRLGGLQLDRRDSRVPTGMPAFFSLVKPMDYLPLQVCFAALDDLREGRGDALSLHDRRLFRRIFEAIMREYAERILDARGDESHTNEIVAALISEVAQRLSAHKAAIQRFCYVYQEAFLSYLEERQSQAVEAFAQALQSNTVPDGVLLVEGPSDKIYFSALLRLLNTHHIIIRIIDCKSKQKVVINYRLFSRYLPFLGSITAVVDGDAQYEERELRHLSRDRRHDLVFRLSSKEIEDVFPIHVHTYVLRQCYFGGEPVELEPPARNKSIGDTIDDLLWSRIQQRLRKVEYANNLVSTLQSAQEYPEELARIIRDVVARTEVCARRSRLNQDVMARDLWQRLQVENRTTTRHR